MICNPNTQNDNTALEHASQSHVNIYNYGNTLPSLSDFKTTKLHCNFKGVLPRASELY